MKRASIIVAAAMAVAGIGFTPATRAADSKSTGATTAPSVLHMAANSANSTVQHVASVSADSQIQSALQGVTQAAMTPGEMPQLAAMLSSPAEQNIRKSSSYSQNYGTRLDAQIASFNKTWKQKFGHDFAISKAGNVLNSDFAAIKTQLPAAKGNSLESANVDLSGKGDATNLQVSLVCEKNNNWKINAADSLTAEKLRDNLLAQITQLNNQSAKWPGNETQAYRSVTEHVLMAVLDKPLPASHTQASSASAPAAKTTLQTGPTVKAVSVAPAPSRPWWKFW